jgi:two-component sensor histidine kinase/CheY-like chemotaxis protein
MCASNRGEVRWLRISAAPVPDSEYGVAIMEDVTAARRAEEQRALLMSEVNHRAKNILSVVQSIAMSTAGAEESEFVEKFQQRVQALSANQDLLVRSEWKGVDLQRLVRAQLAHFADLLDERITLSGPDVTVTTAASQSLGMVLHELATNAGKYGALTTPEGRVEIEWGVRQDDPATSLFTMRWRESGGPTVVAPARRGFGSTVTGDMARMNLQADVRLDYAPSGIVWELECPAGNCIDSAGDQSLKGARAAQPPTSCAARSRILVVEDEALVALAMARALQRAGHDVLGPTGSVSEALALMRDGCDAAVLDVNLGEETSEPIAEKLTNDQTPFLTVTGYDRSQLPPAFREAPLLTKPANLEAVTAEVGRCLGRAASFTR